jgi:hypothetical protein
VDSSAPDWNLPEWPDEYRIEFKALGEYELDTSDQPVRIYRPAGIHTEIIIPDDYAKALDSTRPLRSFLAGDVAAAGQPDAKDASISVEHIGDPLPEHFLSLLDLLPDSSDIKAIVVLDRPNPNDPRHREESGNPIFTSAASAANGVITFFSPKLTHLLGEEFLHESSHILGEHFEGEMQWFGIAAAIEAGGYKHRDRAALNLEENWAVHLGECVLGGSSESFAIFCERAPLRASVLGMVLRRLLENETSATSHAALGRRATHLNARVRHRALDSLRANEGSAAIRLALALLNGEPLTGFENLTSLDLSGAWLGRRHMDSLPAFSSLEELEVSNTLLTRGSLTFLDKLPNLRRLNLRANDLWASDVSKLRHLQNLQWLDIGMTKINSSAIVALAGMKALRYLNVEGTELVGSADDLRRLLPDCEVVS